VTALFATVDPRNARSIRLLQRLGFGEVTPDEYPHGETEPDDRVFSCSTTLGEASCLE
jgi:RimJ/RimL family protein N-acetyltransferase